MNLVSTYFSDPVAPATSTLVVAGILASGIALIIGLLIPIICHLFRRKEKPVWMLWRSLAGVARLGGIVYLLLFFLRYQGLRPFNYRGWVFVALIPFIIWIVVIIRRHLALKPMVRFESDLQDRYHKYLPKPKR